MMTGWDRVIQFSLDGEDPFHLIFSNGGVTFSDGAHEKPDLVLKEEEDVFYRLMTGELDGMRAFMLSSSSLTDQLRTRPSLPT